MNYTVPTAPMYRQRPGPEMKGPKSGSGFQMALPAPRKLPYPHSRPAYVLMTKLNLELLETEIWTLQSQRSLGLKTKEKSEMHPRTH